MLNKHPRTILCCFLPRGGIITLCFAFGCWAFLGILSEMTTQTLDETFEAEPRRPLSRVERIIGGINVVCGLVYFYSSYLAYQRKWFLIYRRSLVFMALNAVFDLYTGIAGVIECFSMFAEAFAKHTHTKPTQEGEIDFFYLPYALVIIPFLLYFSVTMVQILFIQQTRTYLGYVISKKDAKSTIESN